MPAKPKDPLRPLTEHEKAVLQKISRSLSVSADQMARAKALLAVAEGKSYQQAASLAGRKSNVMMVFRNWLAALIKRV